MFCSQFLREESCKLLSRKPLFSEWSGRKRPWEFHSSGCQFPSASLVSIWSPHPQLCPSPQHPQPVYLTFSVFHEGERKAWLPTWRDQTWDLGATYFLHNQSSCVVYHLHPYFGEYLVPLFLSLSGGSEVEISLLWGFAHYWLRIQLWSRMLF